jgi:type IV pilus modification protein PilV
MNNRGFSLVEVIVAILILTVGVLGLAAAATAVTRMTGEGGRSGGAAAVASSRFERLRATACASLASGTATSGKYSESWIVSASGQPVTVTETVTYVRSRSYRSVVFATYISCAPSV